MGRVIRLSFDFYYLYIYIHIRFISTRESSQSFTNLIDRETKKKLSPISPGDNPTLRWLNYHYVRNSAIKNLTCAQSEVTREQQRKDI